MSVDNKTGLSYWESNSNILLKKYPGFLEEIISGATEDNGNLAPVDIKIEAAVSGEPTLCIKGIFVHSQRDPAREGQRLAEAAGKGTGPVVILGFGLGYAARAAACAAAESGRYVIIVEKYCKLLKMAMELVDLGSLLSQNRIIFVSGGTGDGITNALALADSLAKDAAEPAPCVIRNRALADLDKEWYGAVEDRIRTWTMRDKVNAATQNRFGKRWVRNLSRNMSAIRDCPGISRLAGMASGNANGSEPLPVFLAAAGPSLDKAAPLLHGIHRRCIVVAVDTSLRFFLNNGVQPDFVLVVDPQFWNSRHLDCMQRFLCNGKGHRAFTERSCLVVESAVYPPVLNLPFRNVCLCGSLFPLGSFIEKQVDPKGQLGAGGSVATTAWDFARSLGGREIWIAGLDLAFPDLKTHFRGALFEDRSHSGSNRINPAETWVVRALRDGFPFKAPSASGGQVLTDRRLSLYAAWFENRFAQNNEARSYGLFGDGLAINGLESAQAADLLALPDRREEIDRHLDNVFLQIENDFNKPEEKQKRAERYDRAVSVLARGLENIRDAAERGAGITEKALKYKPGQEQQEKVLKDLDNVMRRISGSEVKEIAGFLLPAAEKETVTANAAPAANAAHDPFTAYLVSTNKLFSSLAETVSLNLEYIKEV